MTNHLKMDVDFSRDKYINKHTDNAYFYILVMYTEMPG